MHSVGSGNVQDATSHPPGTTRAPASAAEEPARRARAAAALQCFARWCAVAAASIGLVVLAGWTLGVDIRETGTPGVITMGATTALGLVLAGAGLWLMIPGVMRPRPRRRLARLLASCVVLFAAATLAEYLFHVDLGIDRILFPAETLREGGAYPGRMSIHAALAFVLIGISLLSIDVETRGGRRPAELLASIVYLTTLLAFVGYVFDVPILYGTGVYTQMAAHAALALLMLSFGVLCARPERGFMAVVSADNLGGLVARTLLPATAAATFLLAWLLIEALPNVGLYETRLGIALFLVACITTLAVLVWYAAAKLGSLDDARRAAEEASRAMLTSIGDAVIGADLDGRITFMNAAASALTGWPEHDARERHISEVLNAVDHRTRLVIEDPVAKVLRDGAGTALTEHTLLLTRDGREIPIDDSGAPIRGTSGTTAGVVLTVHDVTQRRQAEDMLRRSEDRARRLQAVTAALASALTREEVGEVVMREGAAALEAQHALVALLSDDEARFESVRSTVPAEKARDAWGGFPSHAPAVLWEAVRKREPAVYRPSSEAAVTAAEHGDALPLRAFAAAPLVADERVLGALGFSFERPHAFGLDDLNLLKALATQCTVGLDRARLYEAQREAVHLRDDFLSIASHELNTPLTSLKLQIALLMRQTEDATTTRQLAAIDRQADRLAKLVNELLDVSRITAGKLRLELGPLDLDALLREVVGRFAVDVRHSASEILLRSTGSAPGVWDRGRLDQVISNLLSNAIKFGQGKPIEVTLESDGDRVRFSVRDHGIGVDPASQSRIFERFERAVSSRHFGGFGLGLWITRQIIQASGGTIRVESRPGEGSTFFVELPCSPSPGGSGQESGDLSDRFGSTLRAPPLYDLAMATSPEPPNMPSPAMRT